MVFSLFASGVSPTWGRRHASTGHTSGSLPILAKLILHIRSLTLCDPLTEALNRRAMGQAMEQAHARWRRGESYALVLLDLDHFKSIKSKMTLDEFIAKQRKMESEYYDEQTKSNLEKKKKERLIKKSKQHYSSMNELLKNLCKLIAPNIS